MASKGMRTTQPNTDNYKGALSAAKHFSLYFVRHWLATARATRLVKAIVGIAISIILVGCSPEMPSSKEARVKQVQQAIVKGGGEANILNESRTLFARLSTQTNYILERMSGSSYCDGLTGITNLGDVFNYEASEPDRIHVRIHNSHFDTYFIFLLNPNFPEPKGFERIVGNVGFIDSNAASKRQ